MIEVMPGSHPAKVRYRLAPTVRVMPYILLCSGVSCAIRSSFDARFAASFSIDWVRERTSNTEGASPVTRPTGLDLLLGCRGCCDCPTRMVRGLLDINHDQGGSLAKYVHIGWNSFVEKSSIRANGLGCKLQLSAYW